MKRNTESRQGFETDLDVDLRATRDAYMNIWKLQTDKVLQKLKDLFTSGRSSGDVRAFVESVYHDICRRLSLNLEHVRQTFGECVVWRLVCPFIVVRIETREDIMAGIRPGAELEEEGREEIPSVLLLRIPEVEEKVGHQSEASLAHPVNFLDDRGPGKVFEYLQLKAIKRRVHQNSFP